MIVDQHEVWLSVAGEPLEFADGNGSQLTMDRRWTPYIQGQVAVVEPEDLDLIDPRETPRLVLELLQRFGPTMQFVADLTEIFAGPGATVADVSAAWTGLTLADLSDLPGRWYADPHDPTSLRAEVVIRSRERNFDGSVTLRFEGVEARIRDYYLVTGIAGVTVSSLRVLYDMVRGAGVINGPGTGTVEFALAPGRDFDVSLAVDDETGFIRTAGDDVYAQMEPFLTLVGARLWGDENGQLQLTATSDTDTSELELSGARVVQSREQIDMNDAAWADSVQIVYKGGTTSENGYSTFYYQEGTGTPVKTVKVELAGASPVYNWNFDTAVAAIAGPILERLQRRGRVLPVTSLIDYTARPDRTAVLTDVPGSPDLTGIISAVTFDIDAAQMTVTTENLEEITP